jgi:branched-chain amino acid transport system substrate-binding protein
MIKRKDLVYVVVAVIALLILSTVAACGETETATTQQTTETSAAQEATTETSETTPTDADATGATDATDVEVAVEEWHIPFLIPLSGSLAGRMEQQKWVVDTLAADINAAGGISGKPVVIDYYDTALDPTKAVAQMGKAIDAKSLAMIGPVVEQEAKAAMPLAVKEGVFAFSATGTEDLAKTFAPWMIQATQRTDDFGKFVPEMLLEAQPDIKKVVALIQPIYPLMVTYWELMQETFESMGVEVLPYIEVPDGLLDYSTVVVRAMDTGADSVYVSVREDIATKIIKEFKNRGFNMAHVWCGSEAVSTITFLEETGSAGEGVYSVSSPDFEPTETFAQLNARFKEAHGGVSMHSMAYAHGDMLLMIKKFIEELGITGDPAKLAEERQKIADAAFNQAEFEGIQATYRVVDGIAHGIPLYFFQVKNGALELVDQRSDEG